MREGNLAKLDQLVLSGCGDLLLDKDSKNPEASAFLAELPTLLVSGGEILEALSCRANVTCLPPPLLLLPAREEQSVLPLLLLHCAGGGRSNLNP